MTGYVMTRRQRVRAATTEEIMGVAAALLTRNGAGAVSVRAVAREMGTAPAALYRYFPGVDELMSALCVRLFDDARNALEGIAPRHAQCREFRRWALAHRHEFALMFGPPPDVYACSSATARRREAEAELAAVFGGDLPQHVFALYWARLCGLLAMEIFGHLLVGTGDPEPLFEAELVAISRLWACVAKEEPSS